MIQNYLKIALRNLLRHKLFSFINIFGLASGMAICLLALMQVREVFEYDQFQPYPDRTYRIMTDVHQVSKGSNWRLASSPLSLGEVLKKEYGFVENTARVYYELSLNGEMTFGRKTLPVEGAFVDPAFFEMFGYTLAIGRPAVEPHTIVLTHEAAQRFFGKENPIGKTLSTKALGDFTVSGVLAPKPGKSHLQFDLLASMATVPVLNANGQLSTQLNDWKQNWAIYTYVLLRKGTPREALDRILPEIAAQAKQEAGPKFDFTYTFQSQAFSRITPASEDRSSNTWEPTLGGILGVGGMALVILLMAGFNYVNLTLARSLSRAREVGIRKVAGAHRSQLVWQFLSESVLTAFLALGLAYFILGLLELLPSVRQWLTKDIQRDGLLWLFFVGFTLLTGLVAGWVPARVLSTYQPTQVLKGSFGPRLFKGIGLRKVLIVAQFAVSLLFMIFITVYYQQFSFMATASYGFDRTNSINIPLQDANPRLLAAQVARLSGVESVAFMSNIPGFHPDGTQVSPDGGQNFVNADFFSVDNHFVPNLKLSLLAGDNLPVSVSDSAGRFVLLNEKAVQVLKLGNPREAIGKLLWMGDSSEVQVAGVLADFNYQSLARPIRPLVLQYRPNAFRYLNVKVTAGTQGTILPQLEQIWKRFNPQEPFESEWFEEEFYNQHLHLDDQMMLAVLGFMALSIAVLGLLGMVTYTATLRTREVGIRKVLGAQVGQIVLLLARSFTVLLLIAGAIALPIGYLLGSFFLQGFAFHVQIGVITLLSCLGALLLIGGVTIGIQTYRTATINPAHSLRSE